MKSAARNDDGLQEQADAVREMEERNGEVWDELDRTPSVVSSWTSRTAAKVVDGRAPREAHLIQACQLQKQKLDRLRADYERLAKWASGHAEDNPFAEQVCMYAYARLAEWEFPVERWEP